MTNNQQPEIAKLFKAIGADVKQFAEALPEADRRIAMQGIATGLDKLTTPSTTDTTGA